MKNNKIAVLSGVLLIMIFFTSCTANKDNTAEISENISSEAAEISGSSDSEKPWETAYNKTLNDFYNEYNKKNFPLNRRKYTTTFMISMATIFRSLLSVRENFTLQDAGYIVILLPIRSISEEQVNGDRSLFFRKAGCFFLPGQIRDITSQNGMK